MAARGGKESGEPNLSFDFESLVRRSEPATSVVLSPAPAVAPALRPSPSPPSSAAGAEPAAPAKREPVIYTVGALARHVQGAFDAKFPDAVWVEGEVSGVKNAPSGHVYLTLKDPDAVVDKFLRCRIGSAEIFEFEL